MIILRGVVYLGKYKKMLTLAIAAAGFSTGVFASSGSQAGNGTMATKPTIYIVACGGTIAGKAADASDLTGYKAGELSVADLIASVPELASYANIQGEQFCNIDSSDMSDTLLVSLAKRIDDIAARDGVDGIVVTHGTDTMEETAYFTNLTVHTNKPIVFVGSMRPSTAISADGPLNLLEAVQAASCREIGDVGAVIVMNGTIEGARFVEKTDATHVDTFKSRQAGFLGLMQDGHPILYQKPLRKHTVESQFSSQDIDSLPPVAILYCHVGMNKDVVAAAMKGTKGIVMAGVGHGRMPADVWQQVQAYMAAGGVVVRTTRTLGGMVTPVDEYAGTIAGDSLTPQKAKLLLQLALTKTSKVDDIQAIFNDY